jgi:hypothetical protein
VVDLVIKHHFDCGCFGVPAPFQLWSIWCSSTVSIVVDLVFQHHLKCGAFGVAAPF